MLRYRATRHILLLLIIISLFSCATGGHETKKVRYVEKREIPARVAILPAKILPKKEQGTNWPIDPESQKGRFIKKITRQMIYNHLLGKGYTVLSLNKTDKRLAHAKKDDPKTLCNVLNVDGLIYPVIHSASMVSALAFNIFSIKAEVRMVNKEGKELGSWIEQSSKRKLMLPVSPMGAATTVISAMVEPPAKRQMRLVVYDWGWKIAQLIPDNPSGNALPRMVSVDSNIDKGIFSIGEKIRVSVQAEKQLSCSFDIGDFKKSIPMPYTKDGTYKGMYVVKEGDYASMQPLIIHLVRPNGTERIWIEPEGTITIDGIAPPAPQHISTEVSKEGVSIGWSLPEAKDLKGFVVEKADTPVGRFTVVAKTEKLSLLDPDISEGKTYYYRIASVDKAGNRSVSSPVPVTVPFFEKMMLPEQLKGNLIAGTYILKKDAVVSEGELLKIGPGVKIDASEGAGIIVKGTVRINGSLEEPTILKGRGWKGILLDSGKLIASGVIFEGCTSCIHAKEGYVKLYRTTLRGEGKGDAVSIGTDTVCELNKLSISGFERGAFIMGGKGRIQGCEIKGNKIGIEIEAGSFALINNNIFKNRHKDIISHQRLVLFSNYLGTSSLSKLNIEGDIIIKSLLDAPYPHGRKIVFLREKEIRPEEIEERFKYYKVMGKKAFAKRRYGDAYQYFKKALDLKRDRDVYLYLAYIQMAIGETEKIEQTLKKAINLFPYDIRLYQVYVRYLVEKGETPKAISLLDKAIRMNPDNKSLIYLRECLRGGQR
ncbi:MAG: hypothetical protein DRG39_02180 [Deltaproteobacteria bacterium]|nr:MAG: hypothetical protein DRG39_02180 [Deltaproteobacteria bacterium]